MIIASYAVVQVEAGWRIVSPRRMIGRFQDRASALAAGANLARQAIEAGHPVEFLIQGPGGELVAAPLTP